jgi:hypothetical protein
MTSPKRKRDREAEVQKEAKASRRARLLKRVFMLLVSAIVGLYSVHWFAGALPGPKVTAVLQGIKSTAGQNAGCRYYLFNVAVDDSVDSLNMRLEFANRILDYKAGFGLDVRDNYGPMGLHFYDMGSDQQGQCAVNRTSPDRMEDLQVSVAGDTIYLRGSKIPPYSTIGGEVALASDSALNPPMQRFEGSYEYTKLGQVVRKAVQFVDNGVSDPSQ